MSDIVAPNGTTVQQEQSCQDGSSQPSCKNSTNASSDVKKTKENAGDYHSNNPGCSTLSQATSQTHHEEAAEYQLFPKTGTLVVTMAQHLP